MELMNLVGQRFGKLVIVERVARDDGDTWWLCQCDCGTRKAIRAYVLRGGQAKGCGCQRVNSHRTHGRSNTREYFAWCAAKQRCSNPNDKGFQVYGARGITMDPAWAESFDVFLLALGPCPLGHSLDRIDNDGPYAPGNCRWAPRVTQANNKQSNRILHVGGKQFTVAEASRTFGVPYSRLMARLRRGWTDEQSTATP